MTLASLDPGKAHVADDVIGRETELAILDRFLDRIPAAPAALLLSGEPGIGKTTVWREGLASARERGHRTLSCGPVEAETRLSYAALGDLLEPFLEDALPTLPEPQRRALEVALLRAPSSGARADQRAVSLAVLGCLREAASAAPVVVAIDDIQWMDLPSLRVLQFVVRRLKEEAVGVMAAARTSDPTEDRLGVATAFPHDRVHRVHVGPLSVDAIEQVLRDTVGEGFPRTTLLGLHETSGGNPFFAQEIGRALLRRGGEVAAGERPPIPERLQELVEDRLEGLPDRTLEALEVVAALSTPTLDAIAAATDASEVDRRMAPALDSGVVEVAGDRLRFTHPLLSSAVYQKIPPARLRELHARLARIVRDPEERARHLAMSVDGADAAVADALDEAARLALLPGSSTVGGRALGDGLSSHAIGPARRTGAPDPPGGRGSRRGRRHDAGAQRPRASGRTLDDRAGSGACAAGPRAGPRRGRRVAGGLGRVRGRQERGGGRSRAPGTHRAEPRVRLAVPGGPRCIGTARSRGEAAGRSDLQEPRVMAEAFTHYPLEEFLLGRGVDQELLDRGVALEGHMEGEFKSHVLRARFTEAQLLKFTDRLDESRRAFTELLGDAAAHGVETPIPHLRYHLAELECWAGNWDVAMEHARESWAAAQRLRMGASRRRRATSRWAWWKPTWAAPSRRGRRPSKGSRVAETAGEVFLLIPNLAVLGFLELSLDHPAEADGYLSRAIEIEREMGVREPAYFRVVPDEVEALVALGRLEEAEALLDPFEEAGRNLDRAWTIATGARCRALVLAARGDLDGASAAADAAVREHDRLPLPFELGRTLLVRGAVERRAKRKKEARDTLTKALEVFDGLGAALWADKTRVELARIGGRAASSLDLTPTEDRVAALVASGSTNREVADALFVSIHTVEANLKRIYRKLGVRSRTELASKFGSETSGSRTTS